MKPRRPRFLLSLAALLLAALACNLPSNRPTPQGPDSVLTIAAQTLQALASATPLGSTATARPTFTNVALASLTPTPFATATSTPIPCNRAAFISDVSIPDGTSLKPGAAFTKTWRLKNTGSCTWTTSYQLVFDQGDLMGGPASQALGGSVAPGQEVDLSVDLTAPNTPGTYKGFWKLRDPSGVLFGINTGSFWVEIKAVPATPTVTATSLSPTGSLTAPLVAGESGSVRSDGTVLNVVQVGDTDTNASQQGFVSFDVSGLPAGATITEVKVNFSNYDILGGPFAALGCLRLYPQNYGTLDASDFTGGAPIGAVVRWCNTGELSNATFSAPDLKATIQSVVGTSRARFRLQFNDTATNSNSIADMARFGSSITLIISYSTP